MKLLADKGAGAPLVRRLRQEGFSVLYVAETLPGMKDLEVIAIAQEEGALLLTPDKDFGELASRRGLAPSGVLLLPLEGLPQRKRPPGCFGLREHGQVLPGAFSVLDRERLGVRRLA